ncbi:MAG: hypothetical protein ACRDA8_11415 [Shewanella sp.]
MPALKLDAPLLGVGATDMPLPSISVAPLRLRDKDLTKQGTQLWLSLSL